MPGPIAHNPKGRKDPIGPVCADCYGLLYLDKIERGPRIGVRETWRHIESRPACAGPNGTRYSAMVQS